MMGICRDCKHCRGDRTSTSPLDRGLCEKAGDDLQSNDPFVTLGPNADPHAALFTSPEFGCVQLEAKGTP